jgi:hypothetical protein
MPGREMPPKRFMPPNCFGRSLTMICCIADLLVRVTA